MSLDDQFLVGGFLIWLFCWCEQLLNFPCGLWKQHAREKSPKPKNREKKIKANTESKLNLLLCNTLTKNPNVVPGKWRIEWQVFINGEISGKTFWGLGNPYRLILTFSIITQVIIEILLIWLVEDCVISCYNHLARGDYSGSTNFQNGRLAISEKEVSRMKENAIPKGTKDAAKSEVILFEG